MVALLLHNVCRPSFCFCFAPLSISSVFYATSGGKALCYVYSTIYNLSVNYYLLFRLFTLWFWLYFHLILVNLIDFCIWNTIAEILYFSLIFWLNKKCSKVRCRYILCSNRYINFMLPIFDYYYLRVVFRIYLIVLFSFIQLI